MEAKTNAKIFGVQNICFQFSIHDVFRHLIVFWAPSSCYGAFPVRYTDPAIHVNTHPTYSGICSQLFRRKEEAEKLVFQSQKSLDETNFSKRFSLEWFSHPRNLFQQVFYSKKSTFQPLFFGNVATYSCEFLSHGSFAQLGEQLTLNIAD